MRVHRQADAASFLAAAEAFLVEREALFNLPLAVARTARDEPGRYPGRNYFAVVEDQGRVAGFAMMTPPQHLQSFVAPGPVALTSVVGHTPHGARIGAVYTPPELRRRGYATALVADVSRRQLAEGKRFCFLFTDLANPISNSIYPKVGYRPVADFREY